MPAIRRDERAILFGGINLRADSPINGDKLTKAETTVGTWRSFGGKVNAESPNCLKRNEIRACPHDRCLVLSTRAFRAGCFDTPVENTTCKSAQPNRACT